MKKEYEAWEALDGTSCTLVASERVAEWKRSGAVEEGAVLAHTIVADTWEEAMAVHHIKLGYRPYQPMGEAEPCPRGCGAVIYPEGSGECPNCGRVV